MDSENIFILESGFLFFPGHWHEMTGDHSSEFNWLLFAVRYSKIDKKSTRARHLFAWFDFSTRPSIYKYKKNYEAIKLLQLLCAFQEQIWSRPGNVWLACESCANMDFFQSLYGSFSLIFNNSTCVWSCKSKGILPDCSLHPHGAYICIYIYMPDNACM